MQQLVNAIVSLVLISIFMGTIISIGWKIMKLCFEGVIRVIYKMFYKNSHRI